MPDWLQRAVDEYESSGFASDYAGEVSGWWLLISAVAAVGIVVVGLAL